MAQLPVIDIARVTRENPSDEDWIAVSKEIGDACLNYGTQSAVCSLSNDSGFFYVTNHGVPDTLVNDLFSIGHEFFKDNEEEKSKILMKYAGKAFRGYFKVIILSD